MTVYSEYELHFHILCCYILQILQGMWLILNFQFAQYVFFGSLYRMCIFLLYVSRLEVYSSILCYNINLKCIITFD